MLSVETRISRLQQTLRRLEEDVPLLEMRVRELTPERRESARRFAQSVIVEARNELMRLAYCCDPWLEHELPEPPCEPAD
jgi:hypothetical protein